MANAPGSIAEKKYTIVDGVNTLPASSSRNDKVDIL
eukprot:CAMPEP_0178522138 /NCGR_PEP_ID=MMETSP0696-20121128/28370_1 /TAXON_ID=265572 /ORGANISM="Extubocellulus spinifer, Strain CCMP396" /LENGTH=35 /DNA_ID= /DNA_START= /DNA_END= /DNA_ORIENTATION=